MATVSIRNLSKAYNKLEVIKSISAEIGNGEFLVLVGPSGCGKSTLLRMIAGLEDITAGEIAIEGQVVNDVSPKDRDIAMVFQNYALYPHMTVAENMGFSLSLKRVDKATIRQRVAETAESLGLTAFLDRYPKQLSGGQRQRVAMGRAIVRSPKVFLFDEPLSNLDAKLRVQMRTELKQLHQRLGVTSIYVTHDQIEAMTMADKIIILREGVIEQVGSPLDLFDRPANAFVATFIGSPAMNMFAGTVTPQGFQLASGETLPIDRAVLPQSETVTLGLRPEHIAVSDTGALEGTVVSIEPTGTETMLMVDVAGQPVTILARQRFALVPGDKVRLAPELAQAHLFDADGARLP